MENTFLTSAQFEVTLKLAQAYGHAWANEAAVIAAIAQQNGASVELISAIMAERNYPGEIPGIQAPTISDDGVVVHTTDSGRLRWEIQRNGCWKFLVNRPGIDGLITVENDWTGKISVQFVQPEKIFLRHVYAAKEAAIVAAGVGWFRIFLLDNCFAELVALAKQNEPPETPFVPIPVNEPEPTTTSAEEIDLETALGGGLRPTIE
jgi:hypothetical protein